MIAGHPADLTARDPAPQSLVVGPVPDRRVYLPTEPLALELLARQRQVVQGNLAAQVRVGVRAAESSIAVASAISDERCRKFTLTPVGVGQDAASSMDSRSVSGGRPAEYSAGRTAQGLPWPAR